MRNPWGKGEWKGDWSDGSKLWTASLKEQIGMEEKDDGIFYISETDYLEQFIETTICMYKDDV